MQHNIFQGLDLWVVLYAAGMAFIASGLTTWRARNAQRLRGLPLSSWLTAIPDTLAGTFIGTALGVLVPPHVPALNNLSGITLLCGTGGILGPKFWDLISSKGLNAALSLEAVNGYNPLRIGFYDRLVAPGEGNWRVELRDFPASFDGYDCALAHVLGLEFVVLGQPIDRSALL